MRGKFRNRRRVSTSGSAQQPARRRVHADRLRVGLALPSTAGERTWPSVGHTARTLDCQPCPRARAAARRRQPSLQRPARCSGGMRRTPRRNPLARTRSQRRPELVDPNFSPATAESFGRATPSSYRGLVDTHVVGRILLVRRFWSRSAHLQISLNAAIPSEICQK